MNCRKAGLILALLGLLAPRWAHAAIVELQPLSFGRVVVRDNSTPQTITVPAVGAYSHSAGFIIITPPTSGRYEITGLPLNGTILSMTVTEISPLAAGGGNNFTMDTFDAVATDPDATGMSILRLGARAVSSGGGAAYADDSYIGELSVEFNF